LLFVFGASGAVVGVGQQRMASVSVDGGSPSISHRCCEVVVRAVARSSLALGVGQDKDPLTAMGCPDFGSCETVPLRIEPEFGQRPENFSEGLAPINAKEPCDVFQENELGSNVAKNPRDVGP
jgi:hypothetical protein